MAHRSRAPLAIGALAAGGIGYYLYSAGGSPRVAEKKMEADAYRASSKIQDHIPSNRSNTAESAEQQGARLGREVGNKLDSAINTINHDLSKAKRETEAYAKQTKAETMKKIDDFDRTVEEKAAKSKSYLSGWFGSK